MKRSKVLRSIQVDEISAVDSAANPYARVMLMKRANSTETNMSTVEQMVEKALSGAVSKSAIDALIRASAEARRAVGESESIAFTKFITADPVGVKLYAAFRKAEGPELHQEQILKALAKKNPSETAADEGKPDANGVFNGMVHAEMKASSCTRSRAIDNLLKTPTGLAHFRAAKQQDRDRAARASPF